MNVTPSPVRYGIIGCGMMGQEHLRNIALLPGARVSRIFEPDEDMARKSLALAPGAQRASSLAERMAPPVAAILQSETGLDPQLSEFVALCQKYRLPD